MNIGYFSGQDFIALSKTTTNGAVSIDDGSGASAITVINDTTNYNVCGVRTTKPVVGKVGMRFYFSCGFDFLAALGNCYVGIGNAANINYQNSHDLLMQNQVGAGAQFIKVAENGGVGHGVGFEFAEGTERVDIMGEIQSDGTIDWYFHEYDGTALMNLVDDDFTFMDNSPLTGTFNAVDANLYFHIQGYDGIVCRLFELQITDETGLITEYENAFNEDFDDLSNFTVVNSEGGEGSVAIDTNRMRNRKTSGASNAFNTLGGYTTDPMGAHELKIGDFIEFEVEFSNTTARDFFALLKDVTGIVYNDGAFSCGMYAEGGFGVTNLRCWDNSTNRGVEYPVSASELYNIREYVNPDGTLSVYAKNDSEENDAWTLVGTTQTANALIGELVRFATNLFKNDTDVFISNLALRTFAENNTAPVVDAGEDQEIEWPTNTTTLDGSATDPEDDDLTYLWTVVSSPDGSSVLFSDDEDPQSDFEVDTEGEYVLQLEASDGSLQDTDQVTITFAEPSPETDDTSAMPVAAKYLAVKRGMLR